MILDRVDYVTGFLEGLPTETVRRVEYTGIRQNSSGMSCIAFRSAGKKRSTLLEVGFVRRIEVGGRVFVAPRYESWRKRVDEIEAFMAEAAIPVAITPPSPSGPKPWWRRLFGFR